MTEIVIYHNKTQREVIIVGYTNYNLILFVCSNTSIVL